MEYIRFQDTVAAFDVQLDKNNGTVAFGIDGTTTKGRYIIISSSGSVQNTSK